MVDPFGWLMEIGRGGQRGTFAPAAEPPLQRDERVVGGEAEAGEQEDRREHQRDLEVVLGVHHLEADALVGADHLGRR